MTTETTHREVQAQAALTDLRFPRQLLLWAMRQSRHAVDDSANHRVLGDALQRVGLNSAHRHLGVLVDCFAKRALRPIQILPPDRDWVSCDEMSILDALGALQLGESAELECSWRFWLPAPAFQLAVTAAAALMSVFSSAGLILGVPGVSSDRVRLLPLRKMLH